MIVEDPAEFLWARGCYTRYSDGKSDRQWIPKESLPNSINFMTAVALLLFLPACEPTPNKRSSTNETHPTYLTSTATDEIPIEQVGRGYFPLIDGVSYEFGGSYDGKTDLVTILNKVEEAFAMDFVPAEESGLQLKAPDGYPPGG